MQFTDDTSDMARLAANQRALTRFAWVFGCGLALALTVPDFFFAATISSFTALAAGIIATIALLAREDPFTRHLTRWDIAAALYAVSLFAGLFVDLEAISHYMILHKTGVHGVASIG